MTNTSRGFTLIELVMVIIVIGIVAVYAAPRFNLDDYEVTEAASEVVEAIRYTQALAMEHSGLADSDTDGNEDLYCFRIAGNNYAVSISDSNSNPAVNVADPVTGAVSYTQSWGTGITFNPAPSVNDICFSSRGEPIDINGAALGANATITVRSGGANSIITVEQLTGFTHQ